MFLTQLFNDPASFLLSIVTRIPAVVIAFTVHEFCHALTAVLCGDDTPRVQGRLTLNPASHVSVWGFIMLLLFGFGWAKPVQVRPGNFKKPRLDDVLVSLAGPFSNLVLAVFVYAILLFIPMPDWLELFVYQAYLVNITLFIFNLLPLPPLDGYHIVKSLIGHKNIKFFWGLEQYGMMILFGLSLIGVLGTFMGVCTGVVHMTIMGLFSFFY